MNTDGLDFASEDFGLAPIGADSDNDDNFDAFNEDTFGAEEAWAEDDHEELAKFNEEEKHTINDGDGFFNISDNGKDSSLKNAHNGGDLAHDFQERLRLEAAHGLPHDPAVLNVIKFSPYSQTSTMPPVPPPHQGIFPQVMRPPPFTAPPSRFPDPQTLMNMGHLPPQMMMMQHQMMMRQPPPQRLTGRIKTVEEVERELLSEQRQRQDPRHHEQHHHQLRPHQAHRQNYQHIGRHQNQNYNQHHQQHHTRNRNPFDDRNRETFGDDFVQNHFQQRKQNQQLIMPGHVHCLGILRGAREKRGTTGVHTESTGNPRRDLELQRIANSARRYDRDDGGHDEFAGLMTHKERQWIINIQLSQLKCENPFLDDYYFTVFKLRKQHEQYIADRNNTFEDENKSLELEDLDLLQPKPEDEGAQLLIQPDSPRETYTPQQFTNSLGKLQASTVKAPRKIIDVGILNTDISENLSHKDSRNYKLTLLELERLYDLLIEVEDCEKKLLALPTNTPLRSEVEEERQDALKKFSTNLTVGNRMKRYLMVRKGKTLMRRGLRLLNDLQMGLVCTTLLQHYSSILRKDREDQLLNDFWEQGIRRHMLGGPKELIQHYLTIMAHSGFALKTVLSSPLGCSVVLSVIHRTSLLLKDNNRETFSALLEDLGVKLSECLTLSPPVKPFAMQVPSCVIQNDSFEKLRKIGHSE